MSFNVSKNIINIFIIYEIMFLIISAKENIKFKNGFKERNISHLYSEKNKEISNKENSVIIEYNKISQTNFFVKIKENNYINLENKKYIKAKLRKL